MELKKYMINNDQKYPLVFIFYYGFIYMNYGVFNIFIPVFLNEAGYSGSSLGILLALGPLVAIAAQPFWGIAGDRAKTKNKVLRIILFGSIISVLFLRISSSFFYLAIMLSVFSFFHFSINTLSDTITLEHIEKTRWNFGPIRLAGTLGFSVMAVVTGKAASYDINHIFTAYIIFGILALLSTIPIPVIKGHQSGSKKMSIGRLFKNRELTLLMVFNFILMSSMGFYYSFFPVYFEQLGGGRTLMGVAYVIAALSETPFLLFASRIFSKIKTKYIMLLSSLAIGIRWLLFYVVEDVYMILPVMLLHGFTFIVLSYSMATYVNKEVPKELRTSGQGMNWVIQIGLSRIIGSVVGGLLVDIVGIRKVFLYDSIMVFITVIVFFIIFIKPFFSKTGNIS